MLVLLVNTQMHGVDYVVDLVLNDMFFAIQVQDVCVDHGTCAWFRLRGHPVRNKFLGWVAGGGWSRGFFDSCLPWTCPWTCPKVRNQSLMHLVIPESRHIHTDDLDHFDGNERRTEWYRLR